MKKFRATSNPQIASPAAPSHTATPFFRLAFQSELTTPKKAIRWLGAIRWLEVPNCFEEAKRADRQNTGQAQAMWVEGLFWQAFLDTFWANAKSVRN